MTNSTEDSWSPGAVLSVQDDQLRVWVAGVTELDGIWIAVPLKFPQALCYAGATFEVKADTVADLPSVTYRMQDLAWLRDDQLFGS